MIQRRGDAHLAEESLGADRVHQIGVHDLDRYLLLPLGVLAPGIRWPFRPARSPARWCSGCPGPAPALEAGALCGGTLAAGWVLRWSHWAAGAAGAARSQGPLASDPDIGVERLDQALVQQILEATHPPIRRGRVQAPWRTITSNESAVIPPSSLSEYVRSGAAIVPRASSPWHRDSRPEILPAGVDLIADCQPALPRRRDGRVRLSRPGLRQACAGPGPRHRHPATSDATTAEIQPPGSRPRGRACRERPALRPLPCGSRSDPCSAWHGPRGRRRRAESGSCAWGTGTDAASGCHRRESSGGGTRARTRRPPSRTAPGSPRAACRS